MRLWSLHPQYLDAKGLVALWREALLAQNVLRGNTKGYKNHPQLLRFKQTDDPIAAIGTYLSAVADEADKRGYNFNRSKINDSNFQDLMPVTSGQVTYELKHLLGKLKTRDPIRYEQFHTLKEAKVHPFFNTVKGDIENWEIR